MGGSGGGGGSSPGVNAEPIGERARRELERQEFVQEVNDYLGELLRAYNDRNASRINDRVMELVGALGDDVADVDRLLFGGSVAKHTYVDGLSDTDALLVLRDVAAESPEDLVGALAGRLRERHAADVVDISPGNLAVTVTYTDGTQLQLLPAQERGGELRIASEDGREWRQIRPRKFAEKLTEVNQANGGRVVPVVKLAKAALQRLAEQHRLSGYHVEAIAVDAFRQYGGEKTREAMLRHLLKHAAGVVLRPTGDITGQSVNIDSHFGGAHSELRRSVSDDIKRIARTIENASSVDTYRELFE